MAERRPNLWCLFCKADSRMLSGLLFDEARALISNLDAAQLENWFAWKDEWPDWRPVNQIEGITEMIYRVMPVMPPPAPKGTEETSLQAEAPISQSSFRQITAEISDALAVATEFVVRDKKRFKKRMQVTIISGTKVFRTYTRDISVGGMNIEECLPDWVNGNFKVRIAKPNSKQQIELMCCLIKGQAVDERYRLAILPLQSVDDERNLELWIAA